DSDCSAPDRPHVSGCCREARRPAPRAGDRASADRNPRHRPRRAM
ncbi:MAG: hypothetical protein AVDCRST_MAG57-1809, partial [uncultured Blastococcus sp.]